MNHIARTIGLGMALSLGITSQAMADNLRLGALVPLTGDLQAYGETTRNGIQLAVDEINAAGGVLGEPIEVSTGDTQTSPQAGVDAAQRLATVAGVHAFVGALSSGVTIPVAQSVSRQEGVPQISGASTSPVITTLDDDDYLFRTVPSDAFQGIALAEIAREADYESLSVLYINNDYGVGLAEAFEAAFTERGGTVSQMAAYEPGQASYRGELRRVSRGDTQGLVLIGYPENGRTILRQAVEGGMFENFVFTDGLRAPDLIDAIGPEFLNGTIGSSPQAMEDLPGAQHFRAAYAEAYGEVPPQPFMDTAYDAVYLIALAAQQAGSLDRDAIRDNLRSVANPPGEEVYPGEWEKALELLANGEEINYEGASGSVDLDEHGDVPGTFAHWHIEDGEIRDVRVFAPEE
ncbi:ABC transporter substrate-binding protein [Aquisalimonas sp.]|uniref:ABC transporter substrate-binding protein n=1 Tax=Aquisalimonas sp. TaxID=1872621 RepID=UPI0025C12F18|nr:ABC transporter substrate-binding protein [Aquisalimonas sp.]